jgi:hypothetical protein
MRVHLHPSRIKAGVACWAIGFLAVAAIALSLPGCSLVSGTVRIEYDFTQGPQQSTGQDVKELFVDLNNNQDFKDNKAKIKSVDEVGFVFRARNLLADSPHGMIYISKTRILPLPPATLLTAAAIQSSPAATKVLQGLVLQPGYTNIDYDASLALEVNQTVLHDTVQGGTFYLYGIADASDFDITIDKLTAVVVVTAEL